MLTMPSAGKRRIVAVAALAQLMAVGVAAQQTHDGYAASAEPLYAVAESGGGAQSPINILTRAVEAGGHRIALHYRPSREHIVNVGHTIEADFDPGSSIEYDGSVYELKQLHFHTPAEHLVDGITYPMELHMVHTLEGRPNRYLVVGILFREGREDPFVEEIVAHAPTEGGARYDGSAELDAANLLRRVKHYYHYEGSLTTPPYTESVTWLVMKDVHEASPSQIERLNVLQGNNARHIQALHGRHVDGK
jgi:carbonic anhydrase